VAAGDSFLSAEQNGGKSVDISKHIQFLKKIQRISGLSRSCFELKTGISNGTLGYQICRAYKIQRELTLYLLVSFGWVSAYVS
jgi:hypothetical protein